MKIGQRLPNGTTVIDFREQSRRPGEQPGGIVLALREGGAHPYVTWQYNEPGFDTYWGHYFESLREARRDFAGRGGAR